MSSAMFNFLRQTQDDTDVVYRDVMQQVLRNVQSDIEATGVDATTVNDILTDLSMTWQSRLRDVQGQHSIVSMRKMDVVLHQSTSLATAALAGVTGSGMVPLAGLSQLVSALQAPRAISDTVSLTTTTGRTTTMPIVRQPPSSNSISGVITGAGQHYLIPQFDGPGDDPKRGRKPVGLGGSSLLVAAAAKKHTTTIRPIAVTSTTLTTAVSHPTPLASTSLLLPASQSSLAHVNPVILPQTLPVTSNPLKRPISSISVSAPSVSASAPGTKRVGAQMLRRRAATTAVENTTPESTLQFLAPDLANIHQPTTVLSVGEEYDELADIELDDDDYLTDRPLRLDRDGVAGDILGGGGVEPSANQILGQYDKVWRPKYKNVRLRENDSTEIEHQRNHLKFSLKFGVMHLDGSDIVFNTLSGDLSALD